MKYPVGLKEKEAIKWMNEAGKMARKALCFRSKCGTVIVKNGKIIGKGYNAPALDKEENRMCDKETCCVHSEWRAIMNAFKNNPNRLKGSRLYFTRVDDDGNLKKSGKPTCAVCSRLALDSGIGYFYLWHSEGIAEYPTDEYNKISCFNKLNAK